MRLVQSKFSRPGSLPGINAMHLFSGSASPGAESPIASTPPLDSFSRSAIMEATAFFQCLLSCSCVSVFDSLIIVPSRSMSTAFMLVHPRSIPIACRRCMLFNIDLHLLTTLHQLRVSDRL